MSVIGLDIGGANLKGVHSDGAACSLPFALWREPAALPRKLEELLKRLPARDKIAITMTGELCDCFATKREGVRHILDAVAAVAGKVPVRVWRTDGRLADLETARKEMPLLAAAANWLALATWAGRLAPKGSSLLIDIGSTTTDIIPLVDGRPRPAGRTDPERLRHSELVYAGVRRTPLCAILGLEAAAESFATTHDVFLILDSTPEDPADTDTADGRPATKPHAHARLAHMLCADTETSTEEERQRLAERVLLKLVYHIAWAVEAVAKRLPGPSQAVIVAGSGEFLAWPVLQQQQAFPPCPAFSFQQQIGSAVSNAACAYALAVLASEQRETASGESG